MIQPMCMSVPFIAYENLKFENTTFTTNSASSAASSTGHIQNLNSVVFPKRTAITAASSARERMAERSIKSFGAAILCFVMVELLFLFIVDHPFLSAYLRLSGLFIIPLSVSPSLSKKYFFFPTMNISLSEFSKQYFFANREKALSANGIMHA